MTEKLDTKITVRTNSTTKKQFAEKAKANGTTPTALINQLMSDYVNGNTTSTNNEDSTTSIDNYTTSTNNEDTSQLEARIEALEQLLANFTSPIDGNRQQKKITETQERLTTLEDNFGHYVDIRTKALKQDLKEIKHDFDWFKPTVAYTSYVKEIEDKVDQKLDRAPFYGWACQLPEIKNRDRENPPSNLPLESTKQDKPYQLSFTEDKPPEEDKTDQSENEAQKADDEGLAEITKSLPKIMTYPKLAKAYGISRNTLESWHLGKSKPRDQTKNKIWEEIKANWEQKSDKWHKKPAS